MNRTTITKTTFHFLDEAPKQCQEISVPVQIIAITEANLHRLLVSHFCGSWGWNIQSEAICQIHIHLALCANSEFINCSFMPFSVRLSVINTIPAKWLLDYLWCMSLLEWLKIWSKFYRIPLFCNTEYPPPPENENCQKSWHFDFSVAEYPPPPPKLKFRQILALWLFSCRIPPPPGKLKFRQILALCDFSVAEYPPPKWKLSEILALTFQLQNTPPPPENENCQKSWHFDFSVAEYPPPPQKLKFREILALCDFSVAEYPPPQKIEI